jgi:hypothetical protein
VANQVRVPAGERPRHRDVRRHPLRLKARRQPHQRAIFEPNEPDILDSGAELGAEDPDLRATLEAYDLKLQNE